VTRKSRPNMKRTALAVRVIRYRTEHGPSQSALARQLGMRQPAIARLVAGDHEPSLATLAPVAWNHSWCEIPATCGVHALTGMARALSAARES